ncbi:MAG: hypothetical protein ACR2KK_11435 [Acidimicrobiales bacterium]
MTRNGRTDIAEAVIDEVRRELGDREAGALLATCGDVTVGRLLPEILYAVASLAPLARRHPGALLDHIEEQLAALPSRQRDLLWHQVGTALPALATADPDRVLRLVEDLGPSHVIPYGIQPVLGRLIRFAPARVAALVVDDGYILTIRWHLPIALRRNIWWFSPADRTAIARALREHEHLLLSVIGLLAPSDRERVFTEAVAGLDTSTMMWSPAFLDVLPHARAGGTGRIRLDRSRQDLLDVLLRPRPLRGRFLKGDVRFVPVMMGRFDRWLPRQVEAYHSALEALIATPGTAAWSRTAAVRVLARLPAIGIHAIRPYLAADDVAVQEAALAGLAWTDQPGDALDELLAYAGSDRARVAVYAATRCARFVPRSQLGRPLVDVVERADAKVTSRKEAARLLGTHLPPGAVDALTTLGSRDDIHRDLRIAIGRALRGSLDDDRAWQLFARLAVGADDEARSLLETKPTQIPPRHRSRYAGLVVAGTRSARQQVRSEAFGLLGTWSPWTSEASTVAASAIGNLAVGREWHAALASLGELLRDGSGWHEVAALVATLAGRTDEGLDAGAERDRPSWQRLVAVVDRVAGLPSRDRGVLRARILSIADLLGTVRSFSPEELIVRFSALDWTHPVAALDDIGTRLGQHPLLAPRVMADLARALDRDQTQWRGEDLGDAADHLIGRSSVGHGVLALQLVQAAGGRSA